MKSLKTVVRALAFLAAVIPILAGKTAPAGATEAATAAPAVGTLRVFGDSYSDPGREVFNDWAEQLLAEGRVAALKSYAKSGALAATVGTNTFARQVRLLKRDAPAFGPKDVTVVFLGMNDILEFDQTFGPSRSGYTAGVAGLLNAGARRNGARLFFVKVPDVGATPAFNGDPSKRSVYRQKTVIWDKFVAKHAADVGGVGVIDLLALFDKVIANPSAYGLTNVKTVDKPRSRTTALWADPLHVGFKGYAIIADEVYRVIKPSAPAPTVALLDEADPATAPATIAALTAGPIGAPASGLPSSP
jgi:phospholipase/lecithinase/hemolysin